ncbi:MAG: sodium:calcium antiporter [Candidatus Scalindua sp. AMX11]|nr:MAG: sodium:calcium antiporter [Candidatus Scalindua sp.]RZV84921.1 MAG: calcium/sodium antiporter [Candidatus Scalindua sp. SCAELEC01]TDE65087.1 MAG: sodium:calcium antiporter [Candidatus Scalindua sp. AMX11]
MYILLLQSILFFIGVFGVYVGAEWFVKGSSNLSRGLGIRPIIIGLTVVAFGTSSPELAVSLTAAFKGSDNISIGNIIGSNIANIGLVLGITAIIIPLSVEKIIMKKEIPLMIGISCLFCIMAMDKMIGVIDGTILFVGIVLYIGYQIYNSINSKVSGDSANSIQMRGSGKNRKIVFRNIVFIALGLAFLLVGAQCLVKSAIFIAGRLGISEMVVGLTVVALGTSIPEMATSVVSAFRRETDICVGNIIGSNIFNILMVIGSVALVRPLAINHDTLYFELPVMLIFSIALIPLIRGNLTVNRIEGFLLAFGYFIFIFFLFR